MATLQRYNPFRELEDISKLFSGWPLTNFEVDSEKSLSFVPDLDVAEDRESFLVRAELPGLKKEDIKISIRDGVLTLSGEKKFSHEEKKENYYRSEIKYGNFARSFSLPNTVDQEKVNANMKDGVLEIKIAKRPEAKEREVHVSVS